MSHHSSKSVVLSGKEIVQSYRIGKREVPVLKGVSFDLYQGELVTLTGSSGSGKTTLMYCLAGLESPQSGEVWIKETSFYKQSASKQAKMRNVKMGYIFQNYYLLPELTALDNVLIPARIGGIRSKDRAKDLLSQLGLEKRFHHLPGELSGGEQQRVAIARALINQPKLVFADEPTGNLDKTTGAEVMEMLLSLAKAENCTLLLVTHDPVLAKQGNRQLQLADGKLK